FISLGLALCAAVGAWLLAGHVESHMVSVLWIAPIMIPLVALARLRQAALQGLQHVVVGQLPEVLIQRLLFIALVGVAYLSLRDDLTAPWAVSLDVLAAVAALLLGIRLLHKALPQSVQEAPPAYEIRVWARSIAPLLFISIVQAVSGQVTYVLLG